MQNNVKAASNVARVLSDGELEAARRMRDSFLLADMTLRVGSGAIFGIAWIRFFCLNEAASVDFSFSVTNLLAVATTCHCLSKASPFGAWSFWRRMWHLIWVPVFSTFAYSFAQFVITPTRTMGRATSIGAAVASACMALTMGYTVPSSQITAKPDTRSIFGKYLLRADGILGLLVIALKYRGLVLDDCFMLMPIFMLSFASLCCRTDEELVAMLPSCVLQILGATVCFAEEEWCPLLFALLTLHLVLFLPLPVSDPLSNIFYASAERAWRSFWKLMSSPVSGFGDGE